MTRRESAWIRLSTEKFISLLFLARVWSNLQSGNLCKRTAVCLAPVLSVLFLCRILINTAKAYVFYWEMWVADSDFFFTSSDKTSRSLIHHPPLRGEGGVSLIPSYLGQEFMKQEHWHSSLNYHWACTGFTKLLESLANLTTLILTTSPWCRSWSLLCSAGLQRLTYRQSATGLPGLLEGEAATAQELRMFIRYNRTQRWGCCIQLNKKTGLAHLWRADSAGGTIFRLLSSGGRKPW